MHMITPYAPPTYLKPCVVFSTLAHETAVCFVEALNANHALSAIYDDTKVTKKSGFVPIKKHKTPGEAAKYHHKLAMLYRNGESDKLWEKGFEPYLKLYEKYCPPDLKKEI